MEMIDYENLVKNVNKRLGTESGVYSDDFCPSREVEFDEVNAWTYWQGKGVRHPRIMVLGQDWGSYAAAEPYLKVIDKMMKDKNLSDEVHIFDEVKKLFPSDRKLIELFKILEDGKYDIRHKMYPDLFFTNLIPGFRKGSQSAGGFKDKWVTQQVKKDLVELVKILRPQVILCLGKNVFEHATLAFGIENVLGDKKWNEYLDDEGRKPIKVNDKQGEPSFLFALPHPGNYGVMNRKKGKYSSEKDWERVRIWLDEHIMEWHA